MWRILTGDGAPGAPAVHGAFLRVLGVISLIAFVSYWIQLAGLIGQNGIVPAHIYLESVGAALGPLERWYRLPTIAWLSSSDLALNTLCACGVVSSLLLVAGVLPRVNCLILWALYLSLSCIDHVFMSFQWDILLIEALFLGVFIAPDRLFLLRWLLFKLMFSSGVCKLASGDPAWRTLTALDYHYETQPIPNAIAWAAHQLPSWFQKVSTVLMFAAELGAPILIFFRPRVLRRVAFCGIVSLQLLIIATGNYCFFNLLTLALCLSLLDDFKNASFLAVKAKDSGLRIARRLYPVVTAVALLVGGLQILFTFERAEMPELAYDIIATASPFRTFNGYGLFAVMTKKRFEITLEGSDDRSEWRAYEFKWKPGPLDRAPPFVAPYQPRLDWQMWFAALGDFGMNPWLKNLMLRLLQGQPETLGLFEKNPFAAKPPRYVRARISRYHFTTFEEREKTGHWWTADEPEAYAPVLSLTSGTL